MRRPRRRPRRVEPDPELLVLLSTAAQGLALLTTLVEDLHQRVTLLEDLRDVDVLLMRDLDALTNQEANLAA